MTSLITHLAYDRIERPRLFATYLVGLSTGALVAAALLAAIGIWSI
jgi:hypothetical protein